MNKNKVLCVIDAQKDFITGSLGTKDAVSVVENIAKKISEWDGVVIGTKDTHSDLTYLSTQEGKKLPIKHCIKGTEGWEIEDAISRALDNAMTYPLIEKSTFGTKAIVDAVKKHCKTFNVSESSLDITIIGYCTDVCVVSNAFLLKEAFPDAEISVDAKCCAGTNEGMHKAALVTMKSCQFNILM